MGLFKKIFGNSQKPEAARQAAMPNKGGLDNTRFDLIEPRIIIDI